MLRGCSIINIVNNYKYYYFDNEMYKEEGVILKKTNLKIISFFVCILLLVTLIPTTEASRPTKILHHRLMVFGIISNFIKLGDRIIGQAKLLVYYGRGILNRDPGVSINQIIMLKMGNQVHTWTFGSYLLIVGHCTRLNFLNFLDQPLFE
jgi:hypothetical protein